MRDIGEGSAVNERRRADERLHEVGTQGILEQRGCRALCVDIACGDGLIIVAAGDDNAGDTRLQISDGGSQTERRHDFAGGRDIKAILARRAVRLSAEPVDEVAELAVVHIHAAFPCNAARVDVHRVALLDAVIHHGGDEVVGGGDGVHVAGEMQVDVLHRDDLRITAACRAAFYAEHRSERRLAQGKARIIAFQTQGIRQTDGNRGLSLARRRRVDGGHQHELALLRKLLQGEIIHLCLILSVRLQQVRRNAERIGNLCDGLHRAGLGNLDIGKHEHPP